MDVKKVEELVALMKEEGLTELSLEVPDFKVTLKRGAEGVEVLPDAATPTRITPQVEAQSSGLLTITAPVVGICHLGGKGESKVELREGDSVEKGQTLATIESM